MFAFVSRQCLLSSRLFLLSFHGNVCFRFTAMFAFVSPQCLLSVQSHTGMQKRSMLMAKSEANARNNYPHLWEIGDDLGASFFQRHIDVPELRKKNGQWLPSREQVLNSKTYETS
jgi:hypothetical protein